MQFSCRTKLGYSRLRLQFPQIAFQQSLERDGFAGVWGSKRFFGMEIKPALNEVCN
jgi:hypothetical protein